MAAPQITLRSGPLEEVREFCYLGSVLASDGRLDREVEERIGKASRAFEALYKVAWKRPEISLTTKLGLYRACAVHAAVWLGDMDAAGSAHAPAGGIPPPVPEADHADMVVGDEDK